ncbi:hypothetical protein AB672_01570 [Xylella taiwanensis]|nr:hypothetical protein AB672_01570 [Xylella taiwanensis]
MPRAALVWMCCAADAGFSRCWVWARGCHNVGCGSTGSSAEAQVIVADLVDIVLMQWQLCLVQGLLGQGDVARVLELSTP